MQVLLHDVAICATLVGEGDIAELEAQCRSTPLYLEEVGYTLATSISSWWLNDVNVAGEAMTENGTN